jgi:hypothetical protein
VNRKPTVPTRSRGFDFADENSGMEISGKAALCPGVPQNQKRNDLCETIGVMSLRAF